MSPQTVPSWRRVPSRTVMANFKQHVDGVAAQAMPVVKEIYENPSNNFERIIIPLTDLRLIYRMSFNLKECYDSGCRERNARV